MSWPENASLHYNYVFKSSFWFFPIYKHYKPYKANPPPSLFSTFRYGAASALRGGAEPREEAASARSQAADAGDGGAANPPIWIIQETKVPLEVSSTKATAHETK